MLNELIIPVDITTSPLATISLCNCDSNKIVSYHPEWFDSVCCTSEQPRPKRLRCEYCGCLSEKDYGTCEHCGAPL